MQHIVQIGSKLSLIDREHRTIGTPENQISALLFSWFVQNQQSTRDWEEIVNKQYLKHSDKAELYRHFPIDYSMTQLNTQFCKT